jgi:cytosine/adenosine deaminase-related metal-dependent hydrolase
MLLLANDGCIFAPEIATDPLWGNSIVGIPEEYNLASLATGHFAWFRAMEQKGCSPMEMLRAATYNIAVAYGKERDLGSIEIGKIADLLILDRNPLDAAENYRSISTVIKDGVEVDRDALPRNPVLTKPMAPLCEEAERYIPFIRTRKFPLCPMCMGH